ncbi:hypothetical protein H3221_022710, partial [Pseudomonas sp. LMG 31766]|uniref:hypothetical protein n=1 Tax=Pseudomonas chaetocerotis TaxID=2758695 RepID=UPI001CCD4A45
TLRGWGFFSVRGETTVRVGCAARTANDADMPVLTVNPAVDTLQRSLVQVVSVCLEFKCVFAMVVLF